MTTLLETPRGTFAVDLSGAADGPALVLVAGLGDDHASWDPVIDALRPGYRVVRYDNRGIGGSDITPGPYSAAQLADDAHAVVTALELGTVVGIGSSLGGAICQEWALRHPGDLSGLVLSSTWAETDPYLGALMGLWRGLVEAGRTAELMDSLMLYCFSGEYVREHPETIDEFRAAPLPDLTGFIAMTQACATHDTLDRLGAVDLPTLVVIGSRDILIRPELSRRLAVALPGASVAEVDASHMTFWEQPDAWTAVVTGWLADLQEG